MPDQDTINEARRAMASLASLPGNQIVTVTLLTETVTGGLGLKDDATTTRSTTTTLQGLIGPDMGQRASFDASGQTTSQQWVLTLPAPSGVAVADWCRTLANFRYNETTDAGSRSVLMIDGLAVQIDRVEPDYLFNAARLTVPRDNVSF